MTERNLCQPSKKDQLNVYNDLINKLLSTEETVDEMDLFFQSIAKSAKKLPLHQQRTIKMVALIALCEMEEENQQPSFKHSYNFSPTSAPSPDILNIESSPQFTSIRYNSFLPF